MYVLFMSLLEKLLKDLASNATSMSKADASALGKTIARTINTQPTIQEANIWKKKKDKDKSKEELAAITSVSGIEAMEIRDGASQEEIEATQKYMGYVERIRNGALSKNEENETIAKLEEAKENILRIRKENDIAGENISDAVTRANQIIGNVKTEQYIADKKKRKSIFKSFYYGMDDPYYDGLKEIYGDEGLEGYRKERPEAFTWYLGTVVIKQASQRYKRVNTPVTIIKSLIGLVIWIASWFVLYPSFAQVGTHPFIYGGGTAILLTILIRRSEFKKISENTYIRDARVKIAKDLGLMDKDKTFEQVAEDNYKDED